MSEPAGDLYKVLGPDGRAYHGGNGKWLIDKKMPEIKDVEPCKRGYHLCRGLPHTDLMRWIGPYIHPVLDFGGKVVVCDEKVVVGWAKIGPAIESWNERTTRLLAADCAERAVNKFWRPQKLGINRGHWAAPRRAMAATRKYAAGDLSGKDLGAAQDATAAACTAARNAAWEAALAAWAAACTAAGDAAWAATAAAAGDAARAAAVAAAVAAARAAAGGAAGISERRWQTKKLLTILKGEDGDG